MILLHIVFGTLSVIAGVIALFVVFKNKNAYYKTMVNSVGVLALGSVLSGAGMLLQNLNSPELISICTRFGVYILFIGLVEGILIYKTAGIPEKSLGS